MLYIGGFILGLISGVFIYTYILTNNTKFLKEKFEEILEAARAESTKLKEEAKESAKKYIEEVNLECQDISKMLDNRAANLNQREQNVDRKEKSLISEKDRLKAERENLKKFKIETSNIAGEQIKALLAKLNLTIERAKEEVIRNNDFYWNTDYEHRVSSRYESLKEVADQKATNIINSIVQKYSKRNASKVVFLPLEVDPGFLIREEKTINALKEITGVEVVFDEEDSEIYVTHFNLVRKTVAYEVLKKLIKKKKGQEIDLKVMIKEESDRIHKNMEKLGEMICKELNVRSLPKEVMKLVGRLNYRTSFGQNIMMHSLEVAFFAEMLAAEVGADIEITKVAALLHDLGKAVDQDIEGPHDLLTKQLLEKYNVDPRIVYAAYNHHDAEEMKTVEARLVQAADAMSASRVGARNESGDQYIERIKALEETALSMPGVQKAFAIQAGREVRTYVDPDVIKDENMEELAKTLAGKIEQNVQYPGQIMVNIIRELRITEQAK